MASSWLPLLFLSIQFSLPQFCLLYVKTGNLSLDFSKTWQCYWKLLQYISTSFTPHRWADIMSLYFLQILLTKYQISYSKLLCTNVWRILEIFKWCQSNVEDCFVFAFFPWKFYSPARSFYFSFMRNLMTISDDSTAVRKEIKMFILGEGGIKYFTFFMIEI